MGVLFILSKRKVLFLLIACLIGLFLVSYVNAIDLNETENGDLFSIEEIDQAHEDFGGYVKNDVVDASEEIIIEDDGINDELSASEESEVLSATYIPENFSDIRTCIDKANDGDTIELVGTYVADSGTFITITKQLNFVGKRDATIDFNSMRSRFSLSNNGITFQDITFKNCNLGSWEGIIYGGSSYSFSVTNCIFKDNTVNYGVVYGKKGVVKDCTFINNIATTSSNTGNVGGAAIYGSNAINCTFRGNSATYGGAMHGGSAVNCNFISNSATYGGAISKGSAINSTFSSNSATYGGAIYQGSANHCNFSENSATKNGGAMYESNADYSNFINNKQTEWDSNNGGGAMYKGSASYSNFTSNYAEYEGGAIFQGSSVNYCNFIQNSAKISGGAVIYCSVGYCNFTGNFALAGRDGKSYGGAIYGGSADHCNFIQNSAISSGGAISRGSATNCMFKDNSAPSGSAIGAGSTAVSIVDCTFKESGTTFISGTNIKSVLDCIFDTYPSVSYHYTSILKVNDLSIVKGENGILTVNLSNILGPLTNKNIIFTINDANYTNTTDSNGIAKYNVKDILTESGIHSVAINYLGDEVNNPGSCISTVILRFDSNLSVNDLSVVRGEDGFLVVNLSDSRGGVANKEVNFTVNGNSYVKTTDGNGLFSINVKDYLFESGFYDVDFNFLGDNVNNPISNTSHVIIRYDSILSLNNLSILLGDDGFLVANLSDSRGPLVNKNITFSINNENYTRITNSQGIFIFNVKDTLTESGIYSVHVSYDGDDVNNPMSSCSTVILRFDSNLIVNDLSVVRGEDGFLVVNLSDSRGGVANKEVNFTVNGNSYVKTTDSNGLVYVNVKEYLFESGFYDIDFNFLGDNVNNPISNTSHVIVRYDSNLNTENLYVALGEDGFIIANLSDSRGPIADKIITFKINDNSYNDTTNSEGIAKLNVNGILTESGVYICYINFEGDEVNNPISVHTVAVIKYDSTLTVNNLSILTSEEGSLLVSLFVPFGGIYNKNITFTINGTDHIGVTDSKGQFSINVKDYFTQSGIYKIDFNYTGDEMSNPSSNSSTVILRFDSNLSVNDLSVVRGEDGFLVVNLSDSRGGVANKNITFTINNVNHVKITDDNGQFSINVKDYLFESGIYTINFNFNGDNINNPISTTSTVIIRYDTTLNADDLSVFITEDGFLKAKLSDSRGLLANKNVTFTINNNDYINTTDSNGFASINIKNYLNSANTYNVKITFKGDQYNNPTSRNVSVVIKKYNSALNVNNLTIFQGENGFLTAILSDSRGPLANKIITFNVNGKKRTNTTNADGIASINVKDDLIDVDEYTVNVSFAGDDYGNPILTNSTVVVKYVTTLNANDLSIKLGEDGIIKANLSTADGQLANKQIIFTINNNNYVNTTDLEGIAVFNVKGHLTSSGFYTINIKFEGDKFNGPASVSSNVIVRYDSVLTASDLSVYITADGIINAKLTDSRGAQKNKVLTFNIKGINYNSTTNSQGTATFNVKDYLTSADTYTVTISFAGDNENNPISKDIQVTINKYDPTITASSISVFIAQDGILSAKLTDSRGVLVNKVLTFKIKGNDYTNTTNSQGIATFNVKNYLTSADTYKVTVSFAGDDYDKSKSTEVNVEIKKYNPTLTVNDLSIKKGEDGIFNVKLTDSRGVLANKVITFTINGNPYTNTTNSQGETTFNVKNYLTESGIYTVGVSFAGDGYDNPISKNAKVIVRYDSSIAVDNISFSKNDEGILTASLTDSRGALKNKKVSFTVNGQTRTVYTNNYGLASFNVKTLLSESGIYTFNVSFTGDNENNPVSIKAGVVIRYDSNLKVDEVSIYKGESGELVANLSDSRGVLSNKTVTFKIKNIDYNITTDSKGVAVIAITDYLSDLGEYSIGVGFSGDYYNNPVNVNGNVIIKQYESILDVNNLSVIQGDDGILKAKLSNIREPLAYQYVSFDIAGRKVSQLTDGEGIASYNVKNDLTELGDYTITVSFEGNEYNKPVSVETSVRINTYKGILNVTQEGKYYEDAALVFKLVDSYTNKPKSNAVIELKFSNAVTYRAPTDSNGIVRYNCNQFAPGTYNVIASVSDTYADINTVDYNFTISILTGEINITKVENSKTLNIKLYNPENGDVYRNVKVSLQFSPYGESAEVTTSDDGIASYNMKFTPGTYSVIATVNGEYKQFNPTELKDIIISDKDATKVTFESDIVFDYLSSGSTKATVEGGSISISDITVVGQKWASISIDNNNRITVSNISAGNYKLRVVTTPDAAHDSIIAYCDITVNRILSDVSLTNNIVFDYLKKGSTTFDTTGCSVLLENISVDGHPEANITLEGNKITVYNLDAGTYTLRVKTTPDNNHLSFERTGYLTVNRIDSVVNITGDIIFDYLQSGTTSVSIEGGSIIDGNIEIEGYPNIHPTIKDNIITVSGLDAGTYTLKVKSTPDKNHYTVEKTAKVTVNRINSNVRFSLDELVFNYPESKSVWVIVDGGIVQSENISVIGQKDKIDFKDNIITVSGLDAGRYALKVTTTPDKNHKSVDGLINITVNKISSSVGFTNAISFDYLSSGSTFAVVDGGSVNEANIHVIGHPEIHPTIKNNRITVSGLNPGTYTLSVTVTPDGNHNSTTNYVGITVNRVNAVIKVSSKTVALKKSTLWTVQVTANGKGIAGVNVVLKVYTGSKYQTVNVKTDANGVASFNTNGLSKGTHKVVASISHIGYIASEASANIKVIKQTKLKFKVKKKFDYDGSALSITVKKGKKPINKVKIKLLIYTGKKLTKTVILKSKKKGKYTGVCGWATNKLTVGNHKVVIKPVKLKYTGSKTVNFKIKKSAKKLPGWETKV